MLLSLILMNFLTCFGRNVSTSIEDIKALNNELFWGIDIIAVSLDINGMFVKWNNKFFKG